MKFRCFWIVTVLAAAILILGPGSGQARPARVFTITAQRFHFDPSEITVKKGTEVTLVIESKDVSHGLAIDAFGVRTEIRKGKTTEVKFIPQTTGTFEGHCAHFCGSGHGTMTFTVHVID